MFRPLLIRFLSLAALIALTTSLASCGSVGKAAVSAAENANPNAGSGAPAAKELWEKSIASRKLATSMMVRGTINEAGVKAKVDGGGLVDNSNFSMKISKDGGGTFTVLQPKPKAYYIKGDEAFIKQSAGKDLSKSQLNRMTSKYMKLTSEQAASMAEMAPGTMLEKLLKMPAMSGVENLLTKVEKTEHAGKPAWKMIPHNGPEGLFMVFSAEPSADLLRVVGGTASGQEMTFEWNNAPTVKAPDADDIITQ